MVLLNTIKHLCDDDSGAVTIDWVALTAAIVALSVAVLLTVTGNVPTLADGIAADVTAAETLADSF